jgi:wyosine [tRNA(Phe)-imidazoG37] synthetase (radical SAM superfamily)
MKHVFGPVSSKRLGQSLGVDLLPLKSCTWNCVYCQLGQTRVYATERKEFFPKEEILEEIRQAVAGNRTLDWITFVGSGETLLYRGIGWLVRQVKAMTDVPVAVITNGSLLHLQEVREELLDADAVLPSLNAGSEELFNAIDRPAPGYDFATHVEGIRQFRKEYRGKLWMEVMLIAGLNDSVQALEDIADVLDRIRPDMVHLVLPTRPAAECSVEVPGEESIARAVFILSKVARVVSPSKGKMELGSPENLLETVTSIAFRHPLQVEELRHALAECFQDDRKRVVEVMEALFASGRFECVRQGGELYWMIRRNDGSQCLKGKAT